MGETSFLKTTKTGWCRNTPDLFCLFVCLFVFLRPINAPRIATATTPKTASVCLFSGPFLFSISKQITQLFGLQLFGQGGGAVPSTNRQENRGTTEKKDPRAAHVRILPSFTEFFWVFTKFSWIFSQLDLVLAGFTGFYWVLPGIIGFYRVLKSITGLYWVFHGLN